MSDRRASSVFSSQIMILKVFYFKKIALVNLTNMLGYPIYFARHVPHTVYPTFQLFNDYGVLGRKIALDLMIEIGRLIWKNEEIDLKLDDFINLSIQ